MRVNIGAAIRLRVRGAVVGRAIADSVRGKTDGPGPGKDYNPGISYQLCPAGNTIAGHLPCRGRLPVRDADLADGADRGGSLVATDS